MNHFTYRSSAYGLGEDDPAFFDWRRSFRCRLGHDVWIGHGVVVLPGVSMGNGAVAGAGSIVTKDVPGLDHRGRQPGPGAAPSLCAPHHGRSDRTHRLVGLGPGPAARRDGRISAAYPRRPSWRNTPHRARGEIHERLTWLPQDWGHPIGEPYVQLSLPNAPAHREPHPARLRPKRPISRLRFRRGRPSGRGIGRRPARSVFAAGAFKARFGMLSPEQLVGSELQQAVHRRSDHGLRSTLALSTTVIRGRLAPVGAAAFGQQPSLRWSSPAWSFLRMRRGGFASPSGVCRRCPTRHALCRNRVPFGTPGGGTPAAPRRDRIARVAGTVPDGLPPRRRYRSRPNVTLQAEIMEVLSRLGGPGSVAGEIGSRPLWRARPIPRTDLGGRRRTNLRHCCAAIPVTARTQVQSAELDPGARWPHRVHRPPGPCGSHLARFADGGTKATNDAGFSHGLAEFIASAQIRARSDANATLAENRFRLVFPADRSTSTRGEVHHYEALDPADDHARQHDPEHAGFRHLRRGRRPVRRAGLGGDEAGRRGNAGRRPHAMVAVNVSGPVDAEPGSSATKSPSVPGQTAAYPGRILVELTETADIERPG